jgi:dienelactone hydrolase
MFESVMRNRLAHASATLLVTLCFASTAGAQPPDNGTNNKPDNVGTGAYPAMKEEVASLPAHVVYRPRDLAALGSQKLGVVAWGNGGCSDDGASSRFHLLEVASHGYLVIANGAVYSGPGAKAREEAAAPQPGQMVTRTTSTQLVEAIDWAMAENARADSPYFGRIDEDQIALSGFSCGGVQALRHAGDPRVDTLVLMNTGIFNEVSATPMSSEMDITKDALATIHTPTIYILGGETDIAYANGMDDFERINHVPVAAANLPVGHGGTYHLENGGSAAQVAVNWLQWQLRGDAAARAWFVGADCKLCSDAEWTLVSKGLE